MTTTQLRNIGPKSAAWLRQVGVRTADDLIALGAVGAFVKVRRAGFKPSLNLLYSLEGALVGCHWQEIPPERRAQLLADLEQASAQLPPPRNAQPGSPVTTRYRDPDASDGDDQAPEPDQDPDPDSDTD